MPVLAFFQYPYFWGRHEDLRDAIQNEDDVRLEGGQGVAKVHQRRDEDEEIEHNRAHVGDRHGERRALIRITVVPR